MLEDALHLVVEFRRIHCGELLCTIAVTVHAKVGNMFEDQIEGSFGADSFGVSFAYLTSLECSRPRTERCVTCSLASILP